MFLEPLQLEYFFNDKMKMTHLAFVAEWVSLRPNACLVYNVTGANLSAALGVYIYFVVSD